MKNFLVNLIIISALFIPNENLHYFLIIVLGVLYSLVFFSCLFGKECILESLAEQKDEVTLSKTAIFMGFVYVAALIYTGHPFLAAFSLAAHYLIYEIKKEYLTK